jgi:hypothetical protein
MVQPSTNIKFGVILPRLMGAHLVADKGWQNVSAMQRQQKITLGEVRQKIRPQRGGLGP